MVGCVADVTLADAGYGLGYGLVLPLAGVVPARIGAWFLVRAVSGQRTENCGRELSRVEPLRGMTGARERDDVVGADPCRVSGE